MFKYIKYTPMADDYTTHIFNEKDDKCKVHRFDVPYVSVEYTDEADFTELMGHQNPDIDAVEIMKDEFAGAVQNSTQVQRMYVVANEQYSKELAPLSAKYSQEERDTWSSQVAEANAIKDGTAVETPYMTALANDNGSTIEEAADKILSNKSKYDMYSSECLKHKWAYLAALKSEVGL